MNLEKTRFNKEPPKISMFYHITVLIGCRNLFLVMHWSVLWKDPGPQAEQTGALQDYVTSNISPWHLDYTWSNEAEALRAIAVRSPWLIDKQFVLRHFQTLKIIDRGVSQMFYTFYALETISEFSHFDLINWLQDHSWFSKVCIKTDWCMEEIRQNYH